MKKNIIFIGLLIAIVCIAMLSSCASTASLTPKVTSTIKYAEGIEETTILEVDKYTTLLAAYEFMTSIEKTTLNGVTKSYKLVASRFNRVDGTDDGYYKYATPSSIVIDGISFELGYFLDAYPSAFTSKGSHVCQTWFINGDMLKALRTASSIKVTWLKDGFKDVTRDLTPQAIEAIKAFVAE